MSIMANINTWYGGIEIFCTYLVPSRLMSSSLEEAEASVSSESVVDASSCCMPGCKFMCRCPAAAGMWLAAVASPGVGTLCWEPLAADCAGGGRVISV